MRMGSLKFSTTTSASVDDLNSVSDVTRPSGAVVCDDAEDVEDDTLPVLARYGFTDITLLLICTTSLEFTATCPRTRRSARWQSRRLASPAP
jgi:hypothetical protein